MTWQKNKKTFQKNDQTYPDINKTLSPFWSWSARYSFLSAGDLITSSKRLDTDWLIVENLLNRLNITLNNFILNILHSFFVVIYSQSTLFEWDHLTLASKVMLICWEPGLCHEKVYICFLHGLMLEFLHEHIREVVLGRFQWNPTGVYFDCPALDIYEAISFKTERFQCSPLSWSTKEVLLMRHGLFMLLVVAVSDSIFCLLTSFNICFSAFKSQESSLISINSI